MLTFKFAYRNLWRNKRRTQLTMGAMVFACTLLIFTLGYYDGMLWNIINNATKKENGHVTVSAKEYIERPTINKLISPSISKVINEKLSEQINGVCPRIDAFALLSAGKDEKSKTQPAQIMGVDYISEKKFSHLTQCIIKGTFIGDKPKSIIVGNGLAQKLNAKIGDEIVFMGSGADGSIAAELFTLVGIFDTGDKLRDSALAIISLSEMQDLLVLNGKVHTLRIFIKDPLKARNISSQLAKILPNAEVTSWHEIFPQIAAVLTIWFGMQVFTMFVYYGALALITFNTMYMAFLERTREFAVLEAVGMTRFRLAGLIICESVFLSGISGFIGMIIGTTISFTLNVYPISLSFWINSISWGGSSISPAIFCVPTVTTSLMPFVSLIILGVVVAIFPIFKLYMLRPIEALREV